MADTLEKDIIKEICSSGDKTANIPDTTPAGSNVLSFADGFPIATATPQSDNGLPPKRSDMNKVLSMMSKNLEFLQNGGSYDFDSSVATAIGGYPKGARLLFKSGYYEYYIESLKDNNTDEPIEENIFVLPNKGIREVKSVLSSASQLPVASEDTTADFYICLNDGKIYATFIDRTTNPETYYWQGITINGIFFAKDTQSYWQTENTVVTNLNTIYSWVKTQNEPIIPMPDYSAGSSVTLNVEQTATDNILVIVNLSAQDRTTPAQFFIGATVGATADVEIASWSINGANGKATWTIPVPKGYKYKIVPANITVTATKYIIR